MQQHLGTALLTGAAALALGAAHAQAAASGTVAAPKPAAAPKAAAFPQPTSNTVPDPGGLEGIWISPRFFFTGILDEGKARAPRPTPQLLPWAKALMDKRNADDKAGHPYASTKSRCLPAGTPSSMSPPAPLPFQILETPGQITILFTEFNQYRIIRLNQKHQKAYAPGFFGDSVGHWEGQTLVVDTVGLNDETTLGGGVPHTEELHVVERIHHATPTTIVDDIEMTDPKTFVGVWKMQTTMKSLPGVRMEEYYCENDRNTPDAQGNTRAELQSAVGK